jgi:SulP family sulfate permease
MLYTTLHVRNITLFFLQKSNYQSDCKNYRFSVCFAIALQHLENIRTKRRRSRSRLSASFEIMKEKILTHQGGLFLNDPSSVIMLVIFRISFIKYGLNPLKIMFREDLIPKTIACWKEGYSKSFFLGDLAAGITVGIISLPLVMAFAIASGLSPEKGLYTGIIAGFLISLLGGSRVQIGGPTGAFVVIIYAIVQKHGYEGLAIATFMAGLLMIFMGLARFGVFLRFIPHSVTTGFTIGIALSIWSSQVKDFLGFQVDSIPADFISKWKMYFHCCNTWNPWSLGLATGTLSLIFILRRFFPKIPAVVPVVFLATFITTFFDLPVDTIEKKFGAIPSTLPFPHLPSFTLEKIKTLLPDAITIALLGSIESLLSALVADGMTGHRHRSNGELVAQGLSNLASVFFGGIPATGAIARTTANIQMGAKTPFAGIFHAITLLVLMLFAAPYAAKFPLPSLAAILGFVAWNMCERESFMAILKGPWPDALVMGITFFLTILIDLTVAVQVGVILAAILFVKKMSDSTTVKICKFLVQEEGEEISKTHESDLILHKNVPEEVAVFEIDGPFFYPIANLLNEQLRLLSKTPRFFILRMGKVPFIDATGLHALKQFQATCKQKGIVLSFSGIKEELMPTLQRGNIISSRGESLVFPHLENALAYCRQKLSLEQVPCLS